MFSSASAARESPAPSPASKSPTRKQPRSTTGWMTATKGKWCWVAGAIAVPFLSVCIYGVVSSRHVQVEHRIVPGRELPPSAEGLTILQISDLHSGRLLDLNREVAGLLQSLPGDLLIITGDFRRGGSTAADAVEGARVAVSTVLPRMPVFAVQGNNDYSDTMRGIRKLGIRVLDNKAVRIRPQVWLVGWNPYVRDHPKLETLLHPIPPEDAIILASHTPDVILEPGSSRARLILAGHTHGGQIRIPGIRPLFLLTRIKSRYYSGLYGLDDQFLNINRGIGTSIVPLRMFSKPEISSLTFHSAP